MSKAVAGKSAAPFALRPLILPQQLHSTLPNGLQVTLVPRGPLPLVSMRLVISTGSAADPVDKTGVADFTARLMRRGAGGLTADAISDEVDFVGASISGWAGEDSFGVAMNTPAKHFEAMLEIAGKVALRPDFPESEVELSRRRTLAQIANEFDDPGAIADRALTRAVWGSHPYGHDISGLVAHLKSISRADLVKFHRTQIGPKIARLLIVGDLDPDKALKQITRVFGGWSGGPSSIARLPELGDPALKGKVVIVDKADQTQAQVRIGARGILRGHPDQIPLSVMNTILGGGFTSRLVSEIRVKRGLSYGAGCHFDTMKAAGSFTVSSFTKTESVDTLISIALGEVKKMKTKGPTPREVATVQKYIAGLYPARLETNDAVAGAIADVQMYGLPDDWISGYRERICAVTPKRAAEVAATHLSDAKDTVLVLCGNAKQLEPKVKKFGDVVVWKPSDLE